MFSYEMILEDLKGSLSEHRFMHTLGVIQISEKLADYYGINVCKAKLAAALHDCSKQKCITEEMMREIALRTCFPDKYPHQTKGEALLHALASEVIAREKYGITDTEVLSAVRWHTTGCPDMKKLDMLIYSADMIEPSRCFDGVEELRSVMLEGIEKLTFECMKHTVLYLEQTQSRIHQMTLDAYNYLKEKLMRNGENNG